MFRIRPLLIGATALAALLTAPSAYASVLRHAPNHKLSHSASTNWSGYAVSGFGQYTSVLASWTQPAVDCGMTPNAYSSFWVGLDGDTSSTVEQIGTDSDCINGTPTYYAWYELYPKGSAQLVTLAANASIDASVTTDSNGTFTLTITVNGVPTAVSGKVKHASLASAEVIAEAPSSNHGPNGELGLANFGTVSFTGATVDDAALGGQSPDQITMVQGGTTLAQPSAISGGDFSIDWKAASGPPPTHGHGHGQG